MDLEKICSQVRELAENTGDFIRSQKDKITVDVVDIKGVHNFVTYVDTESEKKIVSGLINILPDAGFIAEEGTSTKKGSVYNWVIDPLDGTTNFIHGISPFAVSIALMEHDKVVLGVVFEVMLRECFYAWEGSAAYLNGKEIRVSERKKVSDSLIATGFPYYAYDRLQSFLKTLSHFMINSHGVRRLGSAATDLAYVACGRFEGFYEYSLSPWDVAAGVIIVQQAGGKVCDFSGNDNYIFGKEIIASNPDIHSEFLDVIKNIMTE
ncbi:MAG TPA: inositol monophosphatase [Bacteroidales bacterium]|nr:MAG: inositol monophosphatase [Bacteroidetes bacterium GWF2_33_38]OFY75145.1 MAG: inositol monophosphatase [Bacteroidetes bacterium RIFOXYA12_FULL_33_9]HBF87612.1 inositol monophosphatase [Bacteroidales bacterium]